MGQVVRGGGGSKASAMVELVQGEIQCTCVDCRKSILIFIIDVIGAAQPALQFELHNYMYMYVHVMINFCRESHVFLAYQRREEPSSGSLETWRNRSRLGRERSAGVTVHVHVHIICSNQCCKILIKTDHKYPSLLGSRIPGPYMIPRWTKSSSTT